MTPNILLKDDKDMNPPQLSLRTHQKKSIASNQLLPKLSQHFNFNELSDGDDDFDEPDLSLNVDECKAYQETNESYEKKYPKVQQALNLSFVK